MDIEIILTNDSNIVIERTTIDKEINITQLQNQIESYNSLIIEEQNKIDELSNLNLPAAVSSIIEKEISIYLGNIFSYTQQIIKLNEVLNNINNNG